MINIADKYTCCGCTACVERCPKQCIAMIEDEEGFRYPKVNENLCIDCGICEEVCPVINQRLPRKPKKVFAAKNLDENIRLTSSSGGIFTMIAEQIIKRGGIVFGARFNENWEVVHGYTEVFEGIAAFRGSKYVQSYIKDNYKKAEAFLKTERWVLFSGTPCQIAGLHRFLRKEYEKLVTVDVVCHGVPSPLVFRNYLKKTVILSLNSMPVLTGISFKDKSIGWKKSSFVIRAKSALKVGENSVLSSVKVENQECVLLHETLDKNVFMQGFLKNIYLRPSCYACAAKSGKSESDITLADFWGIANYHPEYDDDKGCGLVFVNTEKGKEIYTSLLNKDEIEVEYEQAFAGNPSIEHSCAEPEQRAEFWRRYKSEGTNCIMPIVVSMRPPFARRCISFVKRIVKRIIRYL